ncbi:MAG: rnr, partial [Bacillales bacterium]|nr:rnr [Bacillales bacterium]
MDEIMKEYAEQILTFMTEEAYKPMSIQEIAEDMGFRESGDFKILVKTLVQMEQSGMVIRTRSDRYGLPEKMSLLKGRLTMNAKGYGFVVPEEAGMDD